MWDQREHNTPAGKEGERQQNPVVLEKNHRNFKALHTDFSKNQYSTAAQQLCQGLHVAPGTPEGSIPLGSCPSASRVSLVPSKPLRVLCLF